MFGKDKRRPRRGGSGRTRRIPPSPEPKGLDAGDVVDQVLRGPNGEAVLVIMHSRPWGTGDDKRLKRKIMGYLGFLERGQIDDHVPDWWRAETTIDLAHMDPIPLDLQATVKAMGVALGERHGVGFRTTTFVDGVSSHEHNLPGATGTTPAAAMRGGSAFTAFVGTRLAASGVEGLRLVGPWSLIADSHSFETERLWESCKAKGAVALAAEVDRWVSSCLEPPDIPESERVLVPLLRPQELMQVPRERVPAADSHEVRWDLFTRFCGPLVVVYALDAGARFYYVTSMERLNELGYEAQGLLAQAVENLGKVLPEVRAYSSEGSCIQLCAGGDYEASLLLMDDVCDGLAEQVAGDLVACVPARDLIFLTGSEDPGGLADLRQRVKDAQVQPASELWQGLMVRRDGRWHAFDARQ